MPKRPDVREALDSGWKPMLQYEPTIYRKTLKLKQEWAIMVYQVRKATELLNPVLVYAGVPIDPCPVRGELGLSGEWHRRTDAERIIQGLRNYVRHD